MSIVRVGLGETKKFADGYDAIFGKKKSSASKKTKAPAAKAPPIEAPMIAAPTVPALPAPADEPEQASLG